MGLNLGRPPRSWLLVIRLVVFPFSFLLPLEMAIIYILLYICIFIYLFIRMLENLCRYTTEPPCPQPKQVGALGLKLDTRRLPSGGRPP
jgi:hypothetical protein